jgi:hypothetical protein
MGRLALHCCDSHLHGQGGRFKRRGVKYGYQVTLSEGDERTEDIEQQLSSTRLLVQTNLPTTHQPSRRLHHHSDAQLGQLTHPHPQSSPSSAQQVHSKVSLRRAVDAVQRCGVACVRADHQGIWRSGRRASSLRTWRWRLRRSSCPSCPTTNPPYVPRPSAVDHLDRDMRQRLTYSRTATVVFGVRYGLANR